MSQVTGNSNLTPADLAAIRVSELDIETLTSKLKLVMKPELASATNKLPSEVSAAMDKLRETSMFHSAMSVAEIFCVHPTLAIQIIEQYYLFAFVSGIQLGAELEAERREINALEELVK